MFYVIDGKINSCGAVTVSPDLVTRVYKWLAGGETNILVYAPSATDELISFLSSLALPHIICIAVDNDLPSLSQFPGALPIYDNERQVGVIHKSSNSSCISIVCSSSISPSIAANPLSFHRYLVLSSERAHEHFFHLVYDCKVKLDKIVMTGSLGNPDLIHHDPDFYKHGKEAAGIARSISIDGGLNPSIKYYIYDAIEYISKTGIPGDIANYGVLHGWSMKYILTLLEHFGMSDRIVYGFETFDGFVGSGGHDNFQVVHGPTYKGATIDVVSASLAQHRNFALIQGDITKMSAGVDFSFPNGLSLALFDMDDYSPTAVTLQYAYDTMSRGGVMIHDHYTCSTMYDNLSCAGQRIAMDEFLKETFMLNVSGSNFFLKV